MRKAKKYVTVAYNKTLYKIKVCDVGFANNTYYFEDFTSVKCALTNIKVTNKQVIHNIVSYAMDEGFASNNVALQCEVIYKQSICNEL